MYYSPSPHHLLPGSAHNSCLNIIAASRACAGLMVGPLTLPCDASPSTAATAAVGPTLEASRRVLLALLSHAQQAHNAKVTDKQSFNVDV